MNHKLKGRWLRFERMHPAQRKIGFLVLIIAELEERHGAAQTRWSRFVSRTPDPT